MKRSYHSKLLVLAGLVVGCLFYSPVGSGALARPTPLIGWSNPQHAYVLFENEVLEQSLDGSPSRTHVLGGTLTGLCGPSAIAMSPRGELYAAGEIGYPKCHHGVEFFARGAYGNVPALGRIFGPSTGFTRPNGVALDRQGNIYVADQNGPYQGSVKIFAAGTRGNVAPIATISGPDTMIEGGYEPLYVAVDAAGEIFVGQTGSTGVQVLKFPPGANGDVAPIGVANLAGENFDELQAPRDSVYVTEGFVRREHPMVYQLRASDLSQVRAITAHAFDEIGADADAEGRLYVQDLSGPGNRLKAKLFEFLPGRPKPSRIVQEMPPNQVGSYVVVGP